MRLVSRIKSRYRSWRRRRASKKQRAPLREFIYLDEVSVYSLIASRVGPIATEFTETERASLQGEIGGAIGANVPSVAKAEVNVRALTAQAQESQVLKKSIVQTTFKELYDIEFDSLVLRSPDDRQSPPFISSLERFASMQRALVDDRWIVNPKTLERGQLVDMEVELEAEGIFRISAIVSAMLDILDGSPEIFGSDVHRDLGQVRSVSRVLGNLLAGLVPIRGKSLEYVVLNDGRTEWLVHRRLADKLDKGIAAIAKPLYVAGVTEQALFWKDIRRVLFSASRVRVFSRVSRDGIHPSWNPVKLANVLETVAPELGRQIRALGSGALVAMAGTAASSITDDSRRDRFGRALLWYAKLLAAHHDRTIEEDDLIKEGVLSERNLSSFGSLGEMREAFGDVARFVAAHIDTEIDNLAAAQYRQVALFDAGLDYLAQPVPTVSARSRLEEPPPDERYLDTEFVAIYW
jgi:hypothetical protein